MAKDVIQLFMGPTPGRIPARWFVSRCTISGAAFLSYCVRYARVGLFWLAVLYPRLRTFGSCKHAVHPLNSAKTTKSTNEMTYLRTLECCTSPAYGALEGDVTLVQSGQAPCRAAKSRMSSTQARGREASSASYQ